MITAFYFGNNRAKLYNEELLNVSDELVYQYFLLYNDITPKELRIDDGQCFSCRNASHYFQQFQTFLGQRKIVVKKCDCDVTLFDHKNKIKGSIDGVIVSSDNRKLLLQWKCCRRIFKYGSTDINEDGPMKKYPNTNFWKYCLEINFYMMMYNNSNHNSKITMPLLIIIERHTDECKIFDVPDLQKEVNEILAKKCYKDAKNMK